MSKRWLILLVYNLLLPVGLLLALPGTLLKMKRRGGYGKNFMQRFGLYRDEAGEKLGDGNDFWIHAVSVGEVLIARKLIEELRRRDETARIVLSTTTSTGYALARELEDERLTAIYNPLDLWLTVGRSLSRVNPGVLVLVEAEVWPNLVFRAKRRGIPVVLVNARLSPRSEGRYLRFHGFVAPIFAMLDKVLVQDAEDRERWGRIGAPRDRIEVAGSIKFDLEGTATADPERVERFREMLQHFDRRDGGGGGDRRRPVMLAGSTHVGEERFLGKVYLKLKEEIRDLFLVVVPRHFERSGDVVEKLGRLGLVSSRRSQWDAAAKSFGGEGEVNTDGTTEPGDDLRCLVVDSTGELRDWYHLADLVVIGKSFLSTGGQNPVEAIAAGKPVFFGPHMENFDLLVKQLVAARGVEQVSDAAELTERLRHALEHPDEAAEFAKRGQAALDEHRGATARTAEELFGWLA